MRAVQAHGVALKARWARNSARSDLSRSRRFTQILTRLSFGLLGKWDHPPAAGDGRREDAAGLPISSHYTDELSAHLLSASQNPVYLEKHAFALDPYLEEPQAVEHGHVRPTERPGNGLTFSEAALAPFAG